MQIVMRGEPKGVAEQPQVTGGDIIGDGGEAPAAGGVRGVDENTQCVRGLAGPDRVRVGLGRVFQVPQQVQIMPA
jgi:hypothetical protein